MKQETFNLFDAINREGIGHEIWGMCKDSSTKAYFGTFEEMELKGQFVYVYRELDETFCFIKESTCGKPTYTLRVANNEFIDLYKL